ncbi:hypothetical protein [Bradyrhizobium lablabi]|uniref:hypothetical protein n=1 Tax=Bradyrhizobium lablabi TaxID=722472 RepID=UPI001BAC0E4F|nr:hypothetical protein [Bradyrhizobium lablabi]MBR0693050.1 hypothetical protein [Bradyrhizobium lablabi]
MSDLIIDANVIRNIAQGNRAAAEALTKLIKSGRRVYIARAAWNELSEQYRELLKDLGVGFSPDSSKLELIKARGNVYADNILQEPRPSKGISGPMPEYGGKRDPISGLKTRPGDAFVGAEAKSLDAELWTLDQQFAKQARQQGVKIAAESRIPSVGGAEEIAEARVLLRPALPMPKPSPVGGLRVRLIEAKAGFKLGLRAALSAENIASMIPDVILAVADKVAAREAIRRIATKFIKEGFAKGVAAGVMRWTEEEVGSNLMNHVTHFRVQGLGDPAGFLTLSYILKLAEVYENYAVHIGYQFSSAKSPEWKDDIRNKGFATLKERGYYFGQNPDALFEYEFIDKLAFVLHHTTDSIVEPAIRYH